MRSSSLLGAPGRRQGRPQAPVLAEPASACPILASGDLLPAPPSRPGTRARARGRPVHGAAASSSRTTRSSASSSTGSRRPTPPAARSSTASRGRASRPRRSTRRSPSARPPGRPRASTSTSRSRTSSAGWPTAGSARPNGHVYNLRLEPAAGRRASATSTARRSSSAPTTSRGDRPGADGAAAAAAARGRRPLPRRRRPAHGRRPAADRRASTDALLAGRSADGAGAGLMVTRKSRARDRADAPRRPRSSPRSSTSIEAELKPGVSTADLDRLAEAHIRAAGAIPSFKGYPGINPRRPFPASVCISIDDEVVHGIPGERTIRDGPDRVGRRRRDRRRLARRRARGRSIVGEPPRRGRRARSTRPARR